jgi:hypothetical protein
MNSSLFKLDFLERCLRQPELETLSPRKKTHLANNAPPFSHYRRLFSYEKDYTDIFRLAALRKPLEYDNCTGLADRSRVETPARWRLILCDQADYYPLVYSTAAHSDIAHASRALCDLHKTYLALDDPNCTVEIDPYVSLEGERLEQLRRELGEHPFTEEDWIFIQRK